MMIEKQEDHHERRLQIWPAGFLHRYGSTYRGEVVINMTTGEELATFPFSLQHYSTMAVIRAYAFIDQVLGKLACPHLAREIAEADRVQADRLACGNCVIAARKTGSVC